MFLAGFMILANYARELFLLSTSNTIVRVIVILHIDNRYL